MVVEYGIMSNRWSVEAEDKLVCYATILIHLGSYGCNIVMLYTEECKSDRWAFSDNIEKRLKEIFGEDVFAFMDKHIDEIKKAFKTIKKLV